MKVVYAAHRKYYTKISWGKKGHNISENDLKIELTSIDFVNHCLCCCFDRHIRHGYDNITRDRRRRAKQRLICFTADGDHDNTIDASGLHVLARNSDVIGGLSAKNDNQDFDGSLTRTRHKKFVFDLRQGFSHSGICPRIKDSIDGGIHCQRVRVLVKAEDDVTIV